MTRIATWNIEWFDALFDKQDRPQRDGDWSRRHNVTRAQQLEGIAAVIRAVNPDLLMIIEAPNSGDTRSTVRALENFAKQFRLRQSKAVMGFKNDTHQEIAALYDPKILSAEHAPIGEPSNGKDGIKAPRFDSVFQLDVDVDGQPDRHVFSKPPLELKIHLHKPDMHLRLIGVHAKSKAPHGAKSDKEATRMSIANRRKQLAQCVWLRERVEGHLDRKENLIILGDFNDGPGLDGYEELFGRSSIEVVLGPKTAPERQLVEPHAEIRLDPRHGWALSSTRFYISSIKRYVNTLLDYVMLSQNLAKAAHAKWNIWHPFDNPKCYEDLELREALLAASDHFPVSVDLFEEQ